MEVKVYGADWCGDTQRTLKHLEKLGVAFKYINVEQDERASAWVKEHNDGKELTTESIITAAHNTVPLSMTMRERKWVSSA